MTAAKHTAGPWERDARYIISGGRTIASVHTVSGIWEVNEANADLIASAPDLLEQRDELLAALEMIMAQDSSAAVYMSESAYDKAVAAIAKARGDLLRGERQ